MPSFSPIIISNVHITHIHHVETTFKDSQNSHLQKVNMLFWSSTLSKFFLKKIIYNNLYLVMLILYRNHPTDLKDKMLICDEVSFLVKLQVKGMQLHKNGSCKQVFFCSNLPFNVMGQFLQSNNIARKRVKFTTVFF